MTVPRTQSQTKQISPQRQMNVPEQQSQTKQISQQTTIPRQHKQVLQQKTSQSSQPLQLLQVVHQYSLDFEIKTDKVDETC